jgi:hypothetical protein
VEVWNGLKAAAPMRGGSAKKIRGVDRADAPSRNWEEAREAQETRLSLTFDIVIISSMQPHFLDRSPANFYWYRYQFRL